MTNEEVISRVHEEFALRGLSSYTIDTMTSRAFQDAFNKYKKHAKLSDTFTVHTLRHCFATHLLESGVEVCQTKELLGHTFIQTTAFYPHLSKLNESITSPLDTLPKKRGLKPKVNTDA
ncbi:MAG: tyrosine-type recombinase/integrase [Ethanoligenens sp.]